MKLKISSNGQTVDSTNGKSVGNVLESIPAQFSSGSKIHLEIELPNTHCNVGGTDPTSGQRACLMCPRNHSLFKPETDRLDEVCLKLHPYLHNLSIIRFGGVAEPFWKGRIFELLELLKVGPESEVKIFTITNGLLLDNETSERWFSIVPKSEVSFSIDATCETTFIKLRRAPEYDRVVQNMDNYCRKRNSDNHVAVLANNINELNIDEIESMIEMTKKHFLHFINLSLTKPVHAEAKPICINPTNQERFIAARELAIAKANEIGVNAVFAADWPA